MKSTLFGLISIMAATAIGCSSTAGDEDPLGESQEQLRDGRLVPEDEVVTLLRKYGFPEREIPRMVCTAKWESSFFEASVNNNRRRGTIVSVDRGLFQINSVHLNVIDPRTGERVGTRNCPLVEDAETLFDADTNVMCAREVFRGAGPRAWYGYRTHHEECDAYRLRGGP